MGKEGIGEWEIFWETQLLKVAQHQQRETLYQNPARKIENSKGNLLYYNDTIFDMRRNSTTTVDHSFRFSVNFTNNRLSKNFFDIVVFTEL